MSRQQLGEGQAYYPKRVNGPAKLGPLYMSTIRVVAAIMGIGVAAGHTNKAILITIVAAYWMQKIQSNYGRGVIKHGAWSLGLWVVDNGGEQSLSLKVVSYLEKNNPALARIVRRAIRIKRSGVGLPDPAHKRFVR